MAWRAPDLLDEDFARILARNGIHGFECVWNLDHRWVQAPNERHGGWAGVARHEWIDADGEASAWYLKVHRGRVSRGLGSLLLGAPTLRREHGTLLRLVEEGFPVTRPVLYAERRVEGEHRALLATRELDGFRSVTALGREWRDRGWPPPSRRTALLRAAASLLRRLHDRRWKMNAFTAWHLMVREGEGVPELRLLDLERAKRTLFPGYARTKDLGVLERSAPLWSRTDRLRFLLAYLGAERLDRRGRRIWRGVESRRRGEGWSWRDPGRGRARGRTPESVLEAAESGWRAREESNPQPSDP